jgi:hypothetical protein
MLREATNWSNKSELYARVVVRGSVSL